MPANASAWAVTWRLNRSFNRLPVRGVERGRVYRGVERGRVYTFHKVKQIKGVEQSEGGDGKVVADRISRRILPCDIAG